MENKIEASPDWIEDCTKFYGYVLTGSQGHWCPDWDYLPIDETCHEIKCCTCGDFRGCDGGDHDLVPILGYENSIVGEQCRQCGKTDEQLETERVERVFKLRDND